jgi:hypothetical protein
VVLGLGGKKKGGPAKAAPSVAPAMFKHAAEEEEEQQAAEEAADANRGHDRAAREAALVDWTGLICTLCKRRLKDRATLTKHVEESELHRTNLAAWRKAHA